MAKRCQKYKCDCVTDAFQKQNTTSSVFQWCYKIHYINIHSKLHTISQYPHKYPLPNNASPSNLKNSHLQQANRGNQTQPLLQLHCGNTLRFPDAASPFGVSSVGMLAPVVAKGINSPFKSCRISIESEMETLRKTDMAPWKIHHVDGPYLTRQSGDFLWI